MNCTAEVRADGCDVWVPTQGQTASHQAAIAASGLPADKVKIHTTYLGGGFGRRGEADFVTDAVETSKAVGAPVKVVWSREDDMQHDFYRPVTYVRMWGALDQAGKPVAFMQRIVQQSLMKRIGALPPNGVDFISVDGSAQLPYDNPEHQGRIHRNRSRHPVRVLAVGWRLRPGLCRRGVRRRDGDHGGEGSVSVPSRPARQGAAPSCGARPGRRKGRLGHAAAGGTCARHRRDGVLRHHRRTGRGSVGDQGRSAAFTRSGARSIPAG